MLYFPLMKGIIFYIFKMNQLLPKNIATKYFTVLCIVTCGYVTLIVLYFALLCTCVPWFYKLHVCEFKSVFRLSH